MGGNRGSGRRHRGPNLPYRTQDRESFQQNIKYPSGSEEEFARHHADLYGKEEHMVDGRHVGRPHLPRRSERARISGQHSMSNHLRDTTRKAYKDELDAATAEWGNFPPEQMAYYHHTSDGMLPRHHTALLPLARAREEPNYLNATNREQLLTKEYAYHSLEDQQDHWESANRAYTELQQVQADHARHRKYRSDPYDHETVDCYNNTPVHHTTPHIRSRSYGLPPPGTYCDRSTTPTEEHDRWIGEDYSG